MLLYINVFLTCVFCLCNGFESLFSLWVYRQMGFIGQLNMFLIIFVYLFLVPCSKEKEGNIASSCQYQFSFKMKISTHAAVGQQKGSPKIPLGKKTNEQKLGSLVFLFDP